jgi:hypothetical protein
MTVSCLTSYLHSYSVVSVQKPRGVSTHSAVKPDVPNCVGLDYTEHMPAGSSASRSCELAMLFCLRRYQEYFAENPCRACVYHVSVCLPERSLCSRSFPKSLLTEDGARCQCHSRMSQSVSVSDVSSGSWRTTQCELTLLVCGNDHWGLPKKISARPQTSALIQGQVMHRKSPRLRTITAQFAHGQYFPDRLISESPASLDISQCEQIVWFSRA